MELAGIDKQIARYLLGEMTEEERAAFEQKLLQDSSFFEEVCLQEDELIMRYLRGQLDESLLARFRNAYLSQPARRARVESARAFRQAVHDADRRRRWGWIGEAFRPSALRAGLAFATAAVIVIAVFLLRPVIRQNPPAAGTSAVVAQKTVPELSFTLEPGLVRSGSGMQISIPAGSSKVQFKLIWRGVIAPQGYQVALGTPERPDAWSGRAVSKDGVLVATVPAEVLVAGDYVLRLHKLGPGARAEDQATYYFRVTK